MPDCTDDCPDDCPDAPAPRHSEAGVATRNHAPITIRPISHADIDSFADALKSVIRERLYLAATTPPLPKQIRDFVTRNLEHGYPQIVAVDATRVIGWCDTVPLTPAESSHVARLGMGIIAEYRGRGIGQRLISRCLEAACEFGFEKVELDVYSHNQKAIRLYRANGFELEGTRKKSRKLDGEYQDIMLMSRFFSNSG